MSDNRPTDPTQVAALQNKRTYFLQRPKKSFVTRVPLESEWKNITLPKEHWVVTWMDVYTGRSLDKQWNELLGQPVEADGMNVTGTSFRGGIAQSYSANIGDSDVFNVEDFVRIANIQGIKSRIATDGSVPGSCAIQLQNPVIQKSAGDGSFVWERAQYKPGRFVSGVYVLYQLKKNPTSSEKLWYRGKLQKVETAIEATIILDDKYFKVVWDRLRAPPETIGLYDSERFFAEEMGEPLLEPMQKFKIYAVNRFPFQILSKYGYEEVLGPGQAKPTIDANKEISMSMSLPADHPLISTSDGQTLTQLQASTVDNQTILKYARPLFTGYISEVTNQQQGPNWLVNITAKDVTCWLDYSRLNVNPSLNLWGLDVSFDAAAQDWPIYTIKYAGMSADKVIESIFMGSNAGDIITPTPLYADPDKRNPVTNSYGKSITVMAPQKVMMHSKVPKNGMYQITTDELDAGWIDAGAVVKTYSVYDGVGNFIKTTDSKLPVYGIGTDKVDLWKKMLPDQIIINPVIEPESDRKVLIAYETFFRQNWPTMQSEYITRREVINTVCKTTNTECYADADGKVWFHPIWTYHSIYSPVYVIQPTEVISWSFTFSDKEVITWVRVHGESFANIIPEWSNFNQVFESPQVAGRYGIRGVEMKNPNLKSPEACKAFAEAMLRRINSNVMTGTVSIILRPEIQLANNVFIPWLNAIGYVTTIESNIQYGRSGITTLGLKYVRHPWEPWAPIEYGAESQFGAASSVPQTSSTTTSGTTKGYGANTQTGQPITSPSVWAANREGRPRSSPVTAADPTSEVTREQYLKASVWTAFVGLEADLQKKSQSDTPKGIKGIKLTNITPDLDQTGNPTPHSLSIWNSPYYVVATVSSVTAQDTTTQAKYMAWIQGIANEHGFIAVYYSRPSWPEPRLMFGLRSAIAWSKR